MKLVLLVNKNIFGDNYLQLIIGLDCYVVSNILKQTGYIAEYEYTELSRSRKLQL